MANESLEGFIRSEKSLLIGGVDSAEGHLKSLVKSMAALPKLFPLYINSVVEERDFNSGMGFYPDRPYEQRFSTESPEGRHHRLSYLGKQVNYVVTKTLRDLRHGEAIPSEIESGVSVQEDVAAFYDTLYKVIRTNLEVERLFPREVPDIVRRKIVPFFNRWEDLLILEYTNAFLQEGAPPKPVTDAGMRDICKKYKLVPDVVFLRRLLSSREMVKRGEDYPVHYKRSRQTPDPKPSSNTSSKSNLLSLPYDSLAVSLSRVQELVQSIYETASSRVPRGNRGDVSLEYFEKGERTNYPLPLLVTDIKMLREGIALKNISLQAFLDVYTRANRVLSGLRTDSGRKKITNDDVLGDKIVTLDRLLGDKALSEALVLIRERFKKGR